jgi:Mg-chelatase subunit ChlI
MQHLFRLEHAPNLKRVWIDDRALHIAFKLQETLKASPDADVVAIVGLAHVKAVVAAWGHVDEDDYKYARMVPRHKHDEADLAKKWDGKKDKFRKQIDEELSMLYQDQIAPGKTQDEHEEKEKGEQDKAEDEENERSNKDEL